jgi:hypothetical protein
MAYGFLQKVDGNGTTAVVTITPTAGSLLVLFSDTSAGGGNPTISVSDGVNTWSIAHQMTSDGSNTHNSIAYAMNVAAGSTTITATYNGGLPSGTVVLTCLEYSGIAPSGALLNVTSVTSSAAPGNNNTFSSANVNATLSPALIIGWCQNASGNGGIASVSPSTSRGSSFSGNSFYEDQRVTTTGNVNATFVSATHGADTFLSYAIAFAEPFLLTYSQQPGSIVINAGDAAYLQVVVKSTAGGSITYQWQDNRSGSFANVIDGTGGTAAQYVTTSLATGATGRKYQCIATDNGGAVTSNSATITVLATYNTTIADFDPDLTIKSWYG